MLVNCPMLAVGITGTIGKISNKQYDSFLGKLIDDTVSGKKTTNPWKGIL